MKAQKTRVQIMRGDKVISQMLVETRPFGRMPKEKGVEERTVQVPAEKLKQVPVGDRTRTISRKPK